MSTEDLKIIQNEAEALKDFPPVAKYSDIQSIWREIYLFGKRSVDYFEKLEQYHDTLKPKPKCNDIYLSGQSTNSKISQLNSKEEIESYLMNDKVKNEKDISIAFISNQVSIIYNSRVTNLGLRLLFSTYIKSVSFMGEFLCNPPTAPEPSSNKKCAERAIKMLLDTPLPPLFYPVLEDKPTISFDAPEIVPILPTAIATSDTTIFIGLKGPAFAMIPIQATQEKKVEVLPIEGFCDEPFSVAYHNGFLTFSSKSIPALHFDPATKTSFSLPVFYLTNLLYLKEKLNPFEPPIVTDGSNYYSIEFGPTPKIKVFTQDMQSIIFDRSFPLKEGSKPLTAPFTELLPLSQKNTASIATNGIYISFIFRTATAAICRIFLLYTGEHLHDVPLDPNHPIAAWTFDTNRPAHFVLHNDRVDVLNNCFTLPMWLTGYVLPEGPPKIAANKNQNVIDGYCNALSIVASRFIGAEALSCFQLNDQCYRTSMEKAVCHFIMNNNRYAAQAFLVFLAIKMSQEENQPTEVTHLLKQFAICFNNDKYEYLRKLIAYVLFSSFDSFCQADSETTSQILLKLIKIPEYKIMLFKWLPKSRLMTRVLNEESLTALCEMALKTHYVFDDLALPLLKEIQYGFVMDTQWENSCNLFSIYMTQLYNQFYSDYDHYVKEDWTLQRFTNCVSFLVFEDLIKIIRGKADTMNCQRNVIGIFFKIGSLENIPGSTIIIQSLYIAFTLAFNLLKNDYSFIVFGKRPRNTGDISQFAKELDIKNGFVPEKIINSLVECTFNSCCSNVSIETIRKNINDIIYMYTTGEISESTLNSRLEYVDKIQPQLLEVVFKYIKGENIVIYEKPVDSASVWFCSTIARSVDFSKDETKVIFALFIPQMNSVWHHIDVLPIQFINLIVEACKLRFYFPSEILQKSTVPLSIDDLNVDEMRASFPTLLDVCKKLGDFSNVFGKFKDYAQIDVFNENNINNLLLTLFRLRIAITSAGNINGIEEQFFNFSKQVLFVGNLQVLNHVFDTYVFLYQNGFTDTRFVEYCIEVVGEFLSLNRFLVAGPGTTFQSLQIIFTAIDFIRTLLSHNVAAAVKALSKFFSYSLSNALAIFAICNERYEIPRPGVKACVTLNHIEFYGTIKEFDGKENFVFVSDNKERCFSKKEAMHTKAIPPVHFDPSLFAENFNSIIKVFEEFKEEEPFQVTFFLASFADFCRDKRFTEKVSNELLSRVINCISLEYVSSHNAICELSILFDSILSNDPLFSFDGDFVYVQPKLSPSALALDASIMPRKKQTKNNNMIISLSTSQKFVSTPIPTTLHSTIKITTMCNSCETEHFSLSTFMIGSNENSRFSTKTINLEKDVLIDINPKNSTLSITCGDKHYKYAIQPSAECIFFSIELIPGVVLSYEFETSFKYIRGEELSEGEIVPFSEEELDIFPVQSSYALSWALINRASSIINTEFVIEAIGNYLFNVSEATFEPDVLAKFALLNLAVIDKDPHSKKLMFRDCPTNNHINAVARKYEDEKFQESIISYIEEEAKRIPEKSRLSPNNHCASIINQTPKTTKLTGFVINDGIQRLINTRITEKKENIILIPINNISESIASLIVDIRHAISILSNTSKTLKCFRGYIERLKSIAESHNINEIEDLFDVFLPQIHTKLTSTDEWHQKSFPSIFKDNDLFTDIIDAQFFLLNGSPLCFPMYAFVPRLLCSTSFVSCIVSMNQKMISFQNFPSSDNENIFLYIRYDEQLKEELKDAKDVMFDISSEPGFSKITHSLSMNDFAILPPYSFFVRPRSPKFDIKKAQFFWKTFSFNDSDIISIVKNKVFNWKPLYSQIILATLDQNDEDDDNDHFTEELYECSPLSSIFSFDVVSFFSYILKAALKSPFAHLISEHTLNKPEGLLPTPEKVINFTQFFPEVNPFKVPENPSSELVAAASAVHAFSGSIPAFTVPNETIKKIADGKNNEGAFFRFVSGLHQDSHLEPLLLKRGIYVMNIKPSEFLAIVKWCCSEETQNIMTQIIGRFRPFILALLLEASSGHLSISSLLKSSQKRICVVNSESEQVLLIPQSSTIAVPKTDDQSVLCKLLMQALINSIEQ